MQRWKKWIAVLAAPAAIVAVAGVTATPEASLVELADQEKMFAFTAESPERPFRAVVAPAIFPIRAGQRYWVEQYDLPSYELIAAENGKLELHYPAVNYVQTMISPTDGNRLDGWEARPWLRFTGVHRFPSRQNWTGEASLQNDLAAMRRDVAPESFTPADAIVTVDNAASGVVTVESPVFELAGGKEYLLRAEFAMEEYPVGTDGSWWMELQNADGAFFYYNVGNFYPRHTPHGEWLPAYLRFDLPPQENLKMRLIFHLSGAPAAVRWRNFDLRECPAMRFKQPRPTQALPLVDDAELRRRLDTMAPTNVAVTDGEVYCNDTLLPKLAYLGFADSGHGYFAESGVEWQYIYLHSALTGKDNWRGEPIWLGPGEYDFAALDRRLAQVMKLAPEAIWMLYVYCDPYPAFGANHPEAITVFEDGKRLMEGSGAERTEAWQAWHYSAASAAYRREVNDFLRALGQHLSASPYGKAVGGVHLAGSHDGQYFPPIYDGSVANQEAFQEWLKQRYHDCAALSRAWQQEIKDFAQITYPSMAEMAAENRYFLTPGRDQRLIDASLFRSESMVETLDGMARALKSGIDRSILVTTYYNDTVAGYDLGKDSLKKLLDSDALDGLVSVVEYAPNRFPGRGGNVTSLGGTLGLHRKLWLAELDYRTEYSETWNERGIAYDQVTAGASRNVMENDAQMRRDLGVMLTRGQGAWFFSLSGPGWSDPAYQRSIQEAVRAARISAGEPEKTDRGQMAVFFSEDDLHYQSRCRNFRLFLHQVNAFFLRDILNRSGLSYDAYLLSDLESPERPDYPINVFVTSAALTESQIRFVEEKLQRDNHMVIFLFDTGRVAPGGFEATLQRLTGIRGRMEEDKIIDYRLQPAQPELPLSEAFRYPFTSMRGPKFSVADTEAEALALYDDASVGAAFRDHGDWKSIYIGAPGALTPELLQAAAREIGVTPLSAPGDAVYAGNGFLVIHAATDGAKELHWQGRCTVTDLTTKEVVAQEAETLTVPMSGGETRWFHKTPTP